MLFRSHVSKSLFNDRFKIVVGGNYSTDANADENFSQNLINDISFEYLLALGGDDGLVPGCIWRMYEILHETGKQLLTWTPAVFCYPTPTSNGHSILLVKRKRNKGVKILKSSDFLQKIANTFRYQIDECPMFYMKGVASTEIVDKVKSRDRKSVV